MRSRSLLFVAAALPLAATPPTSAQEDRVTLSGTITDTSGAALPGVTVTIVETRTGANTAVVTDATGQYVAPVLAPGDYDLTAALSGFKQISRKALHLEAGSHPVIDLRLEIGNVSESVQVRAEAPSLNTADTATGDEQACGRLIVIPAIMWLHRFGVQAIIG